MVSKDAIANTGIIETCSALVDPQLLTPEEALLVESVPHRTRADVDAIYHRILSGEDPLGEAYMSRNEAAGLRVHGEVYTPQQIVEGMLAWAAALKLPARVVDLGCGSGRFALAAARKFPGAQVFAVDSSPMATLICKSNVSACRLQDRVKVVQGDFTAWDLPTTSDGGPTLWIGNPPYVRHHDIDPEYKERFAMEARRQGVSCSRLSGLHLHFLLSIARQFSADDCGMLVTSAEWLDAKYGSIARELLGKLGLRVVLLPDGKTSLFEKVHTTSIIFGFDGRAVGKDVEVHESLFKGDAPSRRVPFEKLADSKKWSPILRGVSPRAIPDGFVRLGDFVRVHRGIATGANRFWVKDRDGMKGKLRELSIPIVSHAKEIMRNGGEVPSEEKLARLITLPEDIDALDEESRRIADRVIAEGRALGIDQGYVASSRRCWWSVPTGKPAAILMTYMARRPPVFAVNPKRVRSLNVVHGLHPMAPLSDKALMSLATYLNSSVSALDGRTYSGGLAKFEPSDVEDIVVPSPEYLEDAHAFCAAEKTE